MCVGVLCRLDEWEEKQVNTWCQNEYRSSDLSFLPHSAGHIIYLSVSLSDQLRKCLCLLAFSVFYGCLCQGMWTKPTLHPHPTKRRSKGELKRAS